MKTRIRQIRHGVYVIDEQIIPSGSHRGAGSYITWDERFGSYEKADEYLKKTQNKKSSE